MNKSHSAGLSAGFPTFTFPLVPGQRVLRLVCAFSFYFHRAHPKIAPRARGLHFSSCAHPRRRVINARLTNHREKEATSRDRPASASSRSPYSGAKYCCLPPHYLGLLCISSLILFLCRPNSARNQRTNAASGAFRVARFSQVALYCDELCNRANMSKLVLACSEFNSCFPIACCSGIFFRCFDRV